MIKMTKDETIKELQTLFLTNSTLSKRSIESAKEALGSTPKVLEWDGEKRILSLGLDYSHPNNFIVSSLLKKLLEGRKLSHFLGLTFREFENFSKDTNHLAAFGSETQTFSLIFSRAKTEIIIELLAKKSAEYPELISKIKEETDLVALNRIVKEGLSWLGLAPISADFNEIYFKKNPEYADFDALEELLGEFYIKITGVSNLKVVAV